VKFEFSADSDIFSTSPYDEDPFSSKKAVLKIGEINRYNLKDEGPTHGLVSHFLKHGNEFLPSLIDELINDIKDIIASETDAVVLDPKTSKQLNVKITGKEGILSIIDGVNDRYLTKKSLFPVEEKIYDKAANSADKYFKYVINRINEIEDCAQKMDGKNFIISYKYLDKDVVSFYSKMDTIFIPVIDHKIASAFKINKSGEHGEKVFDFFHKRKIFTLTDLITKKTGKPEEILI
jgi:hypothetical protein